MLFSQSPSLRALFFVVVVVVYDDPVSFCICWKICLKGNKNPNLRCPRKWIRVSCGCGREGTPSCPVWWLGWGQGGYLGWEGLQALGRAPVPLCLPLEPRPPLLPAGIPPGLPLALGCGIPVWNFPCTSAGWREKLCRWGWRGAAASGLQGWRMELWTQCWF